MNAYPGAGEQIGGGGVAGDGADPACIAPHPRRENRGQILSMWLSRKHGQRPPCWGKLAGRGLRSPSRKNRAADSGSSRFCGLGNLELPSRVDRPTGHRRQAALATGASSVESAHASAATAALVTPAGHPIDPAAWPLSSRGRQDNRCLRCSADARRRRGVESERAKTGNAFARNDHVVDDVDAEQEPGLSSVTRQLHVVSRGGRIPDG